ncbi:MAG: hypothetical protein R3F17_01765 [Planctomycetota bacterium]
MKHVPGNAKKGRMTPEEAAKLARQDKRKLIGLSLLFFMVLVAFITSILSAKNKREQESAAMRDKMVVQAPESQVYVPEFTEKAVFDNLGDVDPTQRTILREPAVLATLKYSMQLTPAHLDALGIQELTPELSSELDAAPGEHRTQPYRFRGEILSAQHNLGDENAPETFLGTLRGEDGQYAHFFVSDNGKDATLHDNMARIDGLFAQMYKREVEGEWINAPLLVSRRLMPTYKPLVLGPDLATPSLADVTDDVLDSTSGIPDQAKWELMAKALQDKGQINWDEAPVLSDEYLERMLQGDDSLRGMPFQIPILNNMDARTVTVGENPLGLKTVMTGWMGNYLSKKANGLIHWMAPIDNPALHDFATSGKLVTGRGFYMKVWAYQASNGSLGRVPVFVMESVDVHTPAPDKSHTVTLWLMLGLTVFFLGLFSWLLASDRRRTDALHKRLLERRRARRDAGKQGQPTA